jgi:hypothetical protein
MSMELQVLSDKQLYSIAEWQAAIDTEGFPLRLAEGRRMDTIDGFLPSYLQNRLTGFECSWWDAGEVVAAHPATSFGHAWKYALGFRWAGSKRDEMRAAWMAAVAYARATDGVVFDDLDGKVRSPEEALTIVHDLESDDQHIVDAAVEEALRRLQSRS